MLVWTRRCYRCVARISKPLAVLFEPLGRRPHVGCAVRRASGVPPAGARSLREFPDCPPGGAVSLARLYVGRSCPYGGIWSLSPWQPSSSISTSIRSTRCSTGRSRSRTWSPGPRRLGMRSVALTDHGNMFGAIQLYKASKEQGVQAILGCEVNVARGRDDGRPAHTDEAVDHLVLLAATEPGYRNLINIVSQGHAEPASQLAPSVTLDWIREHREGLIGLTGCMGGVLAQRILEQGEEPGRQQLGHLRDIFEPGALYVELQDHGLQEQAVLNGILAAAARDLGLPAGRQQRRPLRRARGRRGPALPLLHRAEPHLRRGGGGAPRQLRDVPQVARGDGAPLPRSPGRAPRARWRSPSAAPASSSSSASRCSRASP